MSWDASLDGHSWNYTHNTSRMIYDVLREASYSLPEELSWWGALNGMDREAGTVFLDMIVKGLEARPEKYQAMNPENGWGDYNGLLKVLREMRDVSAAPMPRWWAAG